MKLSKYVFLSSLLIGASFAITACNSSSGGGGSKPKPKFTFSTIFESGRTSKLFKGEEETLLIYEDNTEEKETTYTYELTGKDADQFVTVTPNEDGKSFTVHPDEATPFDVVGGVKTQRKIGIRIISKREGEKQVKKTSFFVIGERYPAANTGYNFSSDVNKKAEVLGKLEEYAMKNYLTGISLFENGGYVRYSSRVKLPVSTYIDGYGFGLLTEGSLDKSSWKPKDATHSNYLQSASSSDPGHINAKNDSGSQIGDLFGYIATSYYGTRLNAAKDGYVWYPVLAADDCPDPIPLDNTEDPTVTIHKQYRIYVKTNDDNVTYRTSGSKRQSFNGRKVQLEDYMTAYQILLTQKTGMSRGAELATDTSYGLKGAYSYYRKTKACSADQADSYWNSMVESGDLGIKSGTIGGKSYIDFEFVNPIDQFTAKYTLSSNLYSPLPKDFLKAIGSDWIEGAIAFGSGSKSSATVAEGEIMNNTLSVGPFYLQDWIDQQEMIFARNDQWFEYDRTKDPSYSGQRYYQIPGVEIHVFKGAQDQDDYIYNQYMAGLLDSTGIPVSRFSEKKGSDLPTKGDATFKLNVNSCTQDFWDKTFWNEPHNPDIMKPAQRYLVKPWMSNKNFLNGLFWSINRRQFADARGVTPSYNYFADSYMADPINGISYNSTKAHKDAEDGFDPALRSSDYGYDEGQATAYFAAAVKELVKSGDITLGSKENPSTITIDISWMYSTDKDTYGLKIAEYFETAFNKDKVGGGAVKLVVNHPEVTQNWQDVYTKHLQVGAFDLGFGAISGNSLNPLNFLEVLKSDNSSSFTLNWGVDTSKVDDNNPISFAVKVGNEEVNKEWSFDAAWAAADHGCVIKNGEPVDSVKFGYTTMPTIGEGEDKHLVNRLAGGGDMVLPFEFESLDAGTTFQVTRIQLSLMGYGTFEVPRAFWEEGTYVDPDTGVTVGAIILHFDNTAKTYEDEQGNKYTFAEYMNHLLFVGLKNESKIKPDTPAEEAEELRNPLNYDSYDVTWGIDLYYNIIIAGSVPTENYYYIELTKPVKPATPEEMRFVH